MSPYLSVIIPCYNEEKRIPKTLNRIWDYLNEKDFTWEIIVVIDGAKDGTYGLVEIFSIGKEGITVLNRKENRGKGYTVREGMLNAKGTIRLFTDADNSTDISHFDKMKPLFDSGYDIVICSRESKDAEGARQAVPQPLLKRLLGDLGNLFIRIVAVRGIRDTQCGFKAFSVQAAEKIFSRAKIDRWGFDVETLALARHFGYKIGIVSAYWVNDAETHVTLGGYLGTLLETLKVRWGLLTRSYER